MHDESLPGDALPILATSNLDARLKHFLKAALELYLRSKRGTESAGSILILVITANNMRLPLGTRDAPVLIQVNEVLLVPVTQMIQELLLLSNHETLRTLALIYGLLVGPHFLVEVRRSTVRGLQADLAHDHQTLPPLRGRSPTRRSQHLAPAGRRLPGSFLRQHLLQGGTGYAVAEA